MLRPALITFSLALLLQGTQAQVQLHGVPSSITSPGTDGSLHGVPASVTSPTPATNQNRRVFIGNRNRVRFGNPRNIHRRRELVPVPIFIPVYDYSDPAVSQADPPLANEAYSPAENDGSSEAADAEREAYNRGAHDALARQDRDSRYGDHYLDSREKPKAAKAARATDKQTDKQKADAEETASGSAPSAPEPEEDTPATVFIFKDGHKLQTQNFAIVGQTLVDFSNKAPRKIKFTDLDLDATRKANDDLGIDLRLP
jgi:hypothetical protein